ncbi:MAG: primosomal protein N' [Desulfotalea sp.]
MVVELNVDENTLVEIALALPLANTYTYGLSKVYQLNLSVEEILGRRVLVPLSGRLVTGYVVEISKKSRDDLKYKVLSVNRLLDSQVLFPIDLLPFFRWIESYYHHPLGLIIKAALPGGLTSKSIKVLSLLQKENFNSAANEYFSEKPSWLEKFLKKGELSESQSKAVLKSKHKDFLTKLTKEKIISLETKIKDDDVKQKIEVCYNLNFEKVIYDDRNFILEPEQEEIDHFRNYLAATLHKKFLFSEAKTIYIICYLQGSTQQAETPHRDIVKLYSGSSKSIKTLLLNKYISKVERRVFRNPFGESLPFYPKIENLTEEQCRVIDEIHISQDGEAFAPFLLQGVTGSGKTEVYLRAAEKALSLGKDVLLLVPEIALATQLEAHFVSRFDNLVALQHSGLSPAEKYDQWTLALNGKAKIVIGARSAIFAPLANLGLIIVDEEHDGTYKQDDSFRYNARDLAVLRGKYSKATVILGSATPALTSFYHANSGKYRLLTMKHRPGSSSLPEVQIVDLGNKKDKTSKKMVFTPPLQEALKTTLENGKQSLLLMNRRGFSAIVLCRDCGETITCKHCNVSMTLHKHSSKLICHYCGFFTPASNPCSACASTNIIPIGFGTERIEEEVRNLLPEAKIARLDSDTAGDRKKFLQILQQMRNGEIDVLIGTQMIAKGHHFPKVVTVGVVWADGSMGMPDFRATEKTYQLISQVTGRAGRGEFSGKVIIQTNRPDHYAIKLAQKHDYDGFYEKELEIRKSPSFPPFVRMISFHFRGEHEDNVRTSACNVSAMIRRVNRDKGLKLEVLGPAPSPIDKIKNNYRWQVLIKSNNHENLHSMCHTVDISRKLLVGKTKIIIDVDPDNMM